MTYPLVADLSYWQGSITPAEAMTEDQVRALMLEFMQSPAGTDVVLGILRENGYSITTERLNEAIQSRLEGIHVATDPEKVPEN